MKRTLILVMVALVASPLLAADGAAIFKAKCAMCHGPDGTAQTPMGKSLKIRSFASPEVQKQTDAELTKIITDGKGKMLAYKGKLSDDEIKSLVAFIRTLKK